MDGWPDHLFPREVRYRVDMLESALELAREGLCLVFIPHFIANLQNKRCLASFKLKKQKLPSKMTPVKRDVFLMKRESYPETKTVKQIARALRNIFKNN